MNFTLEFTENQIAVIDKALRALPLGEAIQVWLSIKNQIDVQQATKVEQNKLGGD